MFWLKRVIAFFRQETDAVTPTPPAGLVPPEPTVSVGSNSSAMDTKPQPVKPAKKPAKKPVSKTKVAVKRSPAKAPARTRTASRSGGRGN